MFFDGMKVGYFRDLSFEKDICDRVVSSPERVPLPLESDGAKSLFCYFVFFRTGSPFLLSDTSYPAGTLSRDPSFSSLAKK